MKKTVSLVKPQIKEFCRSTTLHGLKYIVEDGRHWMERVLWIVSCTFGVASASYLIMRGWAQYSTSPTITSIESTHHPVWDVPFPALTICNVNKVHLSAANDLYFTHKLAEVLEEEKYYGFIEQLAEIIQPEQVDTFQYNISRLAQVLRSRNLNMEAIMLKLTQPCNSMMVRCKWRGEVMDCSKLFSLQKSDAGFCCSFNYIPPERANLKKVPLRVNGAGYLSGISILVDPRLEDYYAALFSFYGLQVLVHSPRDYPEVSANAFILAPRKVAFLQVSAAITYSAPNVRSLDPQQRQCVFADERTLMINGDNSRYTFANCLMQCKLEYMDRICNCTPYFYPDAERVRQCGLEDVTCLATHRRLFNNLQATRPVPGLSEKEEAMSCDCDPTCNDITYSAEISQGDFFKSEFDRTNFFKGVELSNHSILHVYFKDISVLRFRRDVIYSWNDLLSSFGGIVGLCLGSSLLSLMEMIYFFIVRPAFGPGKKSARRSAHGFRFKVQPQPLPLAANRKIRHIRPTFDWVL